MFPKKKRVLPHFLPGIERLSLRTPVNGLLKLGDKSLLTETQRAEKGEGYGESGEGRI